MVSRCCAHPIQLAPEHPFLYVMYHLLDIRPGEYRNNDSHERNSDDPEAETRSVSGRIKTLHRPLRDLHNISVVMVDGPHILKVHSLKNNQDER